MSVIASTALPPIEENGAWYRPIHLEALRVDSVPRFDLYLQTSPNAPFVLYCECNTPFTDSARQRLAQLPYQQLYISEAQRTQYSQYLTEHLADLLQEPALSIKEKSKVLYDSAQAVIEEVMSKPLELESVQRTKAIADHTVAFMTAEDFMIEHFLRTISCDYYLYTHSVNVVAYSVALAMHVGYRDAATLRELANGALLHDIGMSQLKEHLVEHERPLSTNERKHLEEHPRIGYEMARETGALGEIALDIILHHHERLNGAGYPDRLQNEDIGFFTRMVGIADVFDALTTDRRHRPKKNTFEALSLMSGTMAKQLDPELLRLFISIMGAPEKL